MSARYLSGVQRDGHAVRSAGLSAERAEQDHGVLGVQEVQLPEVLDDGLLHAALEGGVELLKGLARGEAGGLDPASPPWLSREATSVDMSASAKLIAPLLFAGAVGEHRQRPRGRRRLQRPEQVRQLRGGSGHAGISRS